MKHFFVKLKRKISSIILRNSLSIEENSIAGHHIKTLPFTIRKKTDKDDAWFYALAQHAEYVFDIGSNVGYMSLMAAIQSNNKGVLLADPNPEALAYAAHNLILNGFSHKVTFVNAFVGNIVGEPVKFYTVGTGAAGSVFSGHAKTAKELNSFYYVKQTVLDELLDKVNYVPDLVKIDVEGAESMVLEGAVRLAGMKKTIFFVEMHSPPELPMLENASKILEWTKQNNYLPYYLSTHKLLESANEIAHRGKCHLLLLPYGVEFPKYLIDIKEGDKLS